MSASIKLLCRDAVASSRRLVIKQFPATVGRGLEADHAINDCWASRIHCQLVLQDGQVHVVDKGSSNGTRLNGERIEDSSLALGDRLTIGVTTYEVIGLKLPNGRRAPHVSRPEFHSV